MKELTFDSVNPSDVLVAYDHYNGSIPLFYKVLEKRGKITIVIRRLMKTGKYNVGVSDGLETPILDSFDSNCRAVAVRFNKHGHVYTPGQHGKQLQFWNGQSAVCAHYN